MSQAPDVFVSSLRKVIARIQQSTCSHSDAFNQVFLVQCRDHKSLIVIFWMSVEYLWHHFVHNFVTICPITPICKRIPPIDPTSVCLNCNGDVCPDLHKNFCYNLPHTYINLCRMTLIDRAGQIDWLRLCNHRNRTTEKGLSTFRYKILQTLWDLRGTTKCRNLLLVHHINSDLEYASRFYLLASCHNAVIVALNT